MNIVKLDKNLGSFQFMNVDYLNFQQNENAQYKLDNNALHNLENEVRLADQFVFELKDAQLVGFVSPYNNQCTIKLIDPNEVSGIDLHYEKPARGEGIITVNLNLAPVKSALKKRSWKIETPRKICLFYCLVNIDKSHAGQWNYEQWENKKKDFETTLLPLLKTLFDCPVDTSWEGSNC